MTTSWAASSYLAPADLTTFVDWTTFAELLQDSTDTALANASAVQNSAVLAALSAAISGMVETYLVGSGRYTVAQLQGLSGCARQYFARLLARLVACEAYDRRPDLSPEQRPRFYQEARDELRDLIMGRAFLPTS